MAVPRSLLRLGVLGLTLFSIIYLSFTLLLQARPGTIGHEHALSNVEDAGLAFPYDPVPRCNFAALSKYPAHNINEPSKFAFATLYCTRKPDTRGPYFETTQSIIWRLLWSDFKSKYPVIVFVCPFIPEEHRRVFKGQGAIVKEIELLDDIIPDEEIKTKRWIDVLCKLNIWKEIEWKRIAFLDSDAFPITNIDDIFDLVPEQQCKKKALDPEDKAVVDDGKRGDDMCNYVYAGVPLFAPDNINAGVLILKPNLDMHAKLIRAARRTEDYKIQDMEQGVLMSKNAFASSGPFPVHILPTIWNVDPDYYREYLANGAEASGQKLKILHVKMWNRFWGGWTNLTQLNDMWDLDWMKMCRFFDSEERYIEARKTGVYQSDLDKFLEYESQKST